jgi:hypothetical protein
LAAHCLSHKKEESWKIRTNKEMEDTLQGGDIVKFIKIAHFNSFQPSDATWHHWAGKG